MIQAEQTITIPAVEEKQFNEQWVYNLIVHAPSLTSGRVSVELLPYNSQTKEIGTAEYMQSFTTNELWEAIEEVPEMATAFQAIIAAVPAMREWLKNR